MPLYRGKINFTCYMVNRCNFDGTRCNRRRYMYQNIRSMCMVNTVREVKMRSILIFKAYRAAHTT